MQNLKKSPLTTLSVLACIGSKALCKFIVITASATKTLDYFSANREHYLDFLRFNFNSIESEIEEVIEVNYRNVPLKESTRLKGLYKTFGFVDELEIFKKLGTVPTLINSCCPVEAKWVYEYVKTFKTKKYIFDNHIPDSQIITPLPAIELLAYLNIVD